MISRQHFHDIAARFLEDPTHFSEVKLNINDDMGDTVFFTYKRLSLEEMGEATKRLKLHRFPDTIDGEPTPEMMKGKVVASEAKKCPTCGHETWKNITKELGAVLQGIPVHGWL